MATPPEDGKVPRAAGPVSVAEPATRPEPSSIVLRVSPDRVVTPPDCACCGAPAPRTRRERRLDGRGILVPCCTECHAHASRDDSRALAVGLASMLASGTALAGVPLLFPPPLLAYALVVALAGLLPPLVAALAKRPPAPGHVTSGRPVFFRWDGALVCRSVGFGTRLAQLSNVAVEEARVLGPIFPRAFVAALAVVVILAVPLHRRNFPEVRIVNVWETRVEVRVDGKLVATVSPTSAESTSAGVVVRIPAGRHRITASDPMGTVVDSGSVVVIPGEPHLYAPKSLGTCFFIETTGYGKAALGTVPEAEALTGTPRFWTIPGGVDFWFRPAPAPEADERSSGGLLRALRQAPCPGSGSGLEPAPPGDPN